MKKHILYAATMLLLAGCTSDDSAGSSEADVRHGVYGYMPSYEFGDQEDNRATRITLTAGEKGLSFAWNQGDVICVVGNVNEYLQSTTHCAMESSAAGSLQTGFDGGAFTLNPSATYYSYYPYDSYYDGATNRTIWLGDQKQTGNSSTAHLGPYNYMVAPKVTTDGNASCLFHFNNVCSPCRFTLTLPVSSNGKTVSELTVTRYAGNDLYFPTNITENFAGLNAEDGENHQATGMTYNEGNDANYKQCKQSLTFTECTIGGDHTLVAWMMLFPKDHSTGRYHVTVKCTDNTVYAGNVTGKKLEGGKAYRFSATLSDYIAMPGSANWAIRNQGATLPYDRTTQVQYSTLSTDVTNALPTETVAAELISGCDILSGQGHDCNGTLVSGVYFRAKSGETSDPAGNIILLPFTTDDSGGYYWLSGGAKILHISTSGAASIINANENSFAAVRTVTR
ncbi:MAG: fimbrillin family protein [Prevotella sp.]|nr:fimbrillin family protein [Prevotella sp.]